MNDELVHVARLLWEPRLAISAGLRCAEFILEERVVFCPDYDEVIRHVEEMGPR